MNASMGAVTWDRREKSDREQHPRQADVQRLGCSPRRCPHKQNRQSKAMDQTQKGENEPKPVPERLAPNRRYRLRHDHFVYNQWC